MTAKLVLLKSGEKLISNVKEGFIEEKLICYLLEKPCTISVNGSYKILDDESDNEENRVSISLQSWPLFSNQNTIQIPPDWILSFVDPTDQLKETYETQVLGLNKEEKENDQNIVLAEQSDSDQQN